MERVFFYPRVQELRPQSAPAPAPSGPASPPSQRALVVASVLRRPGDARESKR